MILNKIKTIYGKGWLVIGILVLTSNCSDTLDLSPETTWAADEFYTTKSDLDAALAGIHSAISSGNAFGDALLQMNTGTDESYKLKGWNENYPAGIMAHNPSSVDVTRLWQTLYGGINNANNFIKYINPDNFDDETEFNKYLGEAKFLRGFMYYHLTCWYNELPLRLEPSKDQSSNHLAPSSVDVIYEQIIDDLEFAAEHLPSSLDAAYIAGHANRASAHAMLAKVYLKAAGHPLQATEINGKNPYQAAKDHCNEVILDGHSLNADYKEVFLNYIQNRYDFNETLFEIIYRNGTQTGFNIAGRIGFTNGLFYAINGDRVGQPWSSPEISPSPIHEFLYEENDSIRRKWNIPGYSGAKNQWNPNGKINELHALQWGYTTGKFRRFDAAYPDDIELTNQQTNPIVTLESPEPLHQSLTGINFPLLRFSDVLLMFAEAENALNGPTAEAQMAVDLVRNRAGIDNLATAKPEAIASKEAFFQELTDERMRELCFEGHRKHDLIRWGLLEEKLQELYESIIYHPNYVPADFFRYRVYSNFDSSKHLSLPYPEQEVLINNLLNQKQGW